jgi:hypothetical protein
VAFGGRTDSLPILVHGPVSPAVAWAFRAFPSAAPGAFGFDPPAILYRESVGGPRTQSDYMGQSATVSETRGWDGALPSDFLAWWVSGSAPTESRRWVLLVRADIASLGSVGGSDLE